MIRECLAFIEKNPIHSVNGGSAEQDTSRGYYAEEMLFRTRL